MDARRGDSTHTAYWARQVCMGNGILFISLPLAGAIAAPFLSNVFNARKDKNYREMVGSMCLGLVPFGALCVIWAANGDSPVRAQNIVLGLVGAAIGASRLIWFGYLVRGMSANTVPSGSSSNGPASNQIGTVNSQGIITQGQVGNNTIINPASPKYSGTLNPKATLLFSPKDEISSIPRLQFGTSNVIYEVRDAGQNSTYTRLLFTALSERQFTVESIDGKIRVSTQITDENGRLIAELIRNEWKVAPPPSSWDRNYTDDALEVRDAFGNVVLQVKVLPDRIQLQGVWWIDLGPPNGTVRLFIRGNSRDGGQVVIVPKQNRSPPPSIDPMFRYPSDQYLGELAARS